MMPTLSITLRNHLSELERLHQALYHFGKEQDLPESLINTMNLALEEIVANVIEHGYEDTGDHSILIRCSIQDGQIMAEVEDDGIPFNPLTSPDPDISGPLENRPVGGLGIYLIRNIMDNLAYNYLEGKNQTRLQKRITA